MFDSEDGKYIGIYIGSSNEIGPRVLAHIADRQRAREYGEDQEKTPYEKRRLNISHIKYWNRRLHVQDLWVIFGKLDRRKGESDEDQALYLNIMEIFAMLLFRSLPPEMLAKFLPKRADLRRYTWTGFSSANPLKQWSK